MFASLWESYSTEKPLRVQGSQTGFPLMLRVSPPETTSMLVDGGVMQNGLIGINQVECIEQTLFRSKSSLWSNSLLQMTSTNWQMFCPLSWNRTWTLGTIMVWDSHCIGGSGAGPSCPVLWGVKGEEEYRWGEAKIMPVMEVGWRLTGQPNGGETDNRQDPSHLSRGRSVQREVRLISVSQKKRKRKGGQ